ncbi:hypothetical protein [Tsukamurella hominis]|uniref:hypothetical protein n=1 Tax=Tsukamurella hominis TaxID=1970232 RepID=UPI0039EC5A58
MSNPDYLYRVVVTAYPEGSLEVDPSDPTGDTLIPREGWAPPGWRPEGRYVEMLGTSDFVWPVTNKTYMSRSTAKKRADLLISCGATAHVERSNRIVWPDNTEERAA